MGKYRRLSCLLIAAAGLAVAAGIAVRGSGRPVVGNQSLASLAAAIAAGTVAVFGLAGAVASDRHWQGVAYCWADWANTPTAGIGGRTGLALLAGAFAMQAILSIGMANANLEAVDDQEDYLRVAGQVVALGGPLRLPGALCRGTFDEDNRHPLYVAFLSLRPTFAFGKGLSVGFGLLATLATGLLAARNFGPLVGGTAAACLAVNAALLQSASLVACETLLVLLISLCWFAVLAGWNRRASRAIGLGVLFGLAYLTKASAFLLAATTVVWMLGAAGSARRRWGLVSCFVAGFVVAAGPLLVRNLRVYHNPLHSFNNRFLFADSFDEGLVQTDLGALENWRRYRSEKPLREIVHGRLLGGWAVETFVLLRSLGPVPFDSGRAVFGLVLLALATAVVLPGPHAPVARGDRDSPTGGEPPEQNRPPNGPIQCPSTAARTEADLLGSAARLLVLWTVVFWAFFAWYLPIAASDRFLLPLVPPLAVVAGIGFVRTARYLSRRGA